MSQLRFARRRRASSHRASTCSMCVGCSDARIGHPPAPPTTPSGTSNVSQADTARGRALARVGRVARSDERQGERQGGRQRTGPAVSATGFSQQMRGGGAAGGSAPMRRSLGRPRADSSSSLPGVASRRAALASLCGRVSVTDQLIRATQTPVAVPRGAPTLSTVRSGVPSTGGPTAPRVAARATAAWASRASWASARGLCHPLRSLHRTVLPSQLSLAEQLSAASASASCLRLRLHLRLRIARQPLAARVDRLL